MPPTFRFWIVCAALLSYLAASPRTAAQDRLVTTDGVVAQGKILGVRGNNVEIQDAAGVRLPFPLQRIRQVEMAEPAELRPAIEKMQAGDYAGALPALSKLAGQFTGLPTDWARQAVAAYGTALVSTGDLGKGEQVFNDYARLYGAAGSADAQAGLARIAVEKGDFAAARSALEPFAAEARKKLHVTPQEGRLYTNVFLLLGRVEEASGNAPAAMENYQLAINVFPDDAAARSEAARRAAALGNVHVP